MPCMSCGEKPKNTAKDFTKAVIKIDNPESLVLLRKIVIPASMGTEEDVPVEPGRYFNVILEYEANRHVYIYSSDGIPTNISANIEALEEAIEELGIELEQEVLDRETADAAIEQEIEELRNSPDVVDIVGTYAELQAYDTSKLGNNDIVRVLADETHENESTYYRWDKTNSQWIFIGAVEGYYTKAQTDNLLSAKQNSLTPGANIQIVNDTISATDTTYTAGSGLNLSGTEFSVDTTTIQEKLTPGANIQIRDDVISATDTTYAAGYGLNLIGTQFSVDTTTIAEVSDIPTKTSDLTNDGADGTDTYVESDTLANYQEKLTAGNNITIASDNTISATDTTYTAGTGLALAGTQFNVNTINTQDWSALWQ